MNKEEQGYFYTFGSILAIQIFFELGLTNIITQFVAHEVTHLKWSNKVELQGSEQTLSRLSSLLHFCITWFLSAAIILTVALLILGFWFFNTYINDGIKVDWQMPWVILCFSTSFSLFLSPILAYLEGLGKVTEIAKIRMIQQSVQLIFLLFFLIGGLKLLASPLAAIIACTIAPLWILFSYKRTLLVNIWRALSQWKVNYKDEIFPFQWRISLSWISGFFIFQLFNPVLFATDGPVTAGQMGMTLAALNGVMSISMSWINTKVPLFSTLIAKKDYITLDKIFDRTLRESTLICGLMLALLILIIHLLQYYEIAVRNRFLPTISIISLCLVTFLNQFIFAYAAYLRSHKKEPLLIQSLVGAVLTSISTIFMGHFYGVNGITIGYLFLTFIIGFFCARNTFNKKKVEWHS